MILTPPLSLAEAAAMIGVKSGTMYKWIAASKAGTFRPRGQREVIAHRRTGSKRGKIIFERQEIERLKMVMTVGCSAAVPIRRVAPVRAGGMPLGIPK